MSLPDFEPLLPDSRVSKIADLLRIAYPDLRDAEFVTFIVPEQNGVPRTQLRQAPHEHGCPYPNDSCECDPLNIPAQAIFCIRDKHPRADMDPVYKGKMMVTTEGTFLKVWESEEKARAHYVSTSQDPAYTIMEIAARAHVKRASEFRQLN